MWFCSMFQEELTVSIMCRSDNEEDRTAPPSRMQQIRLKSISIYFNNDITNMHHTKKNSLLEYPSNEMQEMR